jgi:carbamoyltransferase
MHILGFNAYGHDSAAALLVNDKLVCAVEEERLNRKKHAGGFPKLSIQCCLDQEQLTIDAIDHVAFFWKPFASLIHIPVYALKFWNKLPSLIKEQRNFSVEENLGMLNYIRDMYQLPHLLTKEFTSKKTRFKFHFLEHHVCHAASAFYPSPFEEAAILTIDGAGEWATTLLAKGSGNTISKLKKVNTPYSLGAFYQAISMHLGFKLIEGPGKLMGLASYGNPNTEVYKKMKELFQLKTDGTYAFDTRYFSYYYTRKSGVSKKFTDVFGASKTEGKDWTPHELNVAAAAQHIVEDVVLHMAMYLKKTTRSQNLCMAGGVALNSVTNGLLAKSGLFKEIYIQPAAGDSGTAIGSTLLVNHQLLNRQRQPIETAFLGPSYSKERYISALQAVGVTYSDRGNDCYDYIAEQLYANKIVAWFQGNMEFGPRALGNRSILANPGHPDMKDILNKRVKFRESFRPFAAIVTEEDCATFFDHDYPNPYMLLVYNVKQEKRSILPSITHVDGTVRIQTVNEKANLPMRTLLKAFEKRSGFPVLINTSFNIKSEPIVCTPENAIQSFLASDIDFLVLGNLIVAKDGSIPRERKEVAHQQVLQ